MRILLFLAVFLISSPSFAYPIDTSIGFGLGYTWTESVFNDRVRDISNSIKETPTYSDVTNSSKPFNFYLNFRFHKYYGAELGYINYGKINFNKTLTTAEDGEDYIERRTREASISLNGVYLSHVLYIPVTESILLQAKAGLVFGSSEYSDIETIQKNSSPPQPDTTSTNSTNESLTKPQLAAAILYRSSPSSNWRLQLSQLEVTNDGEKETFTQWFTQLSYEIKL